LPSYRRAYSLHEKEIKMSDYPLEIEKITKTKKVRTRDATVVMEDDECSRIYFWTDKIIFSVCTLLPGQKTPVDQGHKGSYEVIYCIQGHVVVFLPDENRYEELYEEDALCLAEGVPHQAINVGDTISKLSWSLAPHLGR
jgi:mannose-6-phosphate isomerase-like protein (cupin superfamily)